MGRNEPGKVEFIKGISGPCKVEPNLLSPLQWAYLGDVVYELEVRLAALDRGDIPMKELHRWTVGYVKAETQARMLRRIEPLLTEAEREIVRRSRNAKSLHVPKNARVVDYRLATGLEGLLGFLHLDKQYQRLGELLAAIREEIIKMQAEKESGQDKG